MSALLLGFDRRVMAIAGDDGDILVGVVHWEAYVII
jgi:hypothetical protein